MGWFSYDCPEHGNFRLSLDKRKKVAECPICGKEVKMVIMDVFECFDCGIRIRLIFIRDIYGHVY